MLVYPVTTEATDHPGGYQGAIDEFYAEAAARLAAHLDAGRDVVRARRGRPVLLRLLHAHAQAARAPRYRTEVVPGVTSVSAASAALGRPLVERDEVLTVLPGTLPRRGAGRRLADTDSAAVLKLGRTFTAVRDAARPTPGARRRCYVERATTDRQRTAAARRRRPGVGALLLDRAAARRGGRRRRPTGGRGRGRSAGEVVVVGARPRRAGLDDPAGAGGAGRGRRPRRLRPLPRPGAAQPAPAPAPERQPGGGRTGRARARPGRRGPPGRRGVRGRPRRVRDGRRGAGGGRAAEVRRRRRCACCPGVTAAQRGGGRASAPRSGTTTR